MRKENKKASFTGRSSQMNEIFQKLEDGVRSVFSSDMYVRYLETFSKFHNYSISNIIMILIQKPDATQVASFKDWNTKFNRYVKKGEHGIKILVPTPKKIVETEEIHNEDGTISTREVEYKKMYFKPGTVFDISQTAGEDLPSLVRNLESDDSRISDLVCSLMQASEIPIAYDEKLTENDANGYYSLVDKRIAIKPSLSALHQLKTLVHEYSHYLQEVKFEAQIKELDRASKEVIAESCAFCVLEMLKNTFNWYNLSSDEYSFGYIAGWGSKDLSELKSTLSLISTISNSIFEWISPIVA